ncbi:hypothetical protein ACFYNO_19220 [Kitasatospora sp. NPDC006697]|uniref:hypothetical protein n=1 Tax=Kitasatospora sp. NPDC006697 TaxID=3364020 RepID=UPI0036971DAC
MLSAVADDGSTRSGSLIDEIVREGPEFPKAAARITDDREEARAGAHFESGVLVEREAAA